MLPLPAHLTPNQSTVWWLSLQEGLLEDFAAAERTPWGDTGISKPSLIQDQFQEK